MNFAPGLKTLREHLFDPVDAASLVFFRICFGITIFLFSLLHLHLDFMEEYFVGTEFNFNYYGLEWLNPLPGNGMYLLLITLGLSGVLIALGWYYRIAAATSGLVLSYFLLSEPAYYQNHVYLFILLSLLGVFLPLNTTNSVDHPAGSNHASASLPRLSLYLVRFQIGLVYVYAAVAKTNFDWLNCQPLMPELQRHTDLAFIGPLFGELWVIVAATYGVLLLEYLIVPLLLWNRSRNLAFGLITVFHFLNASIWGLDVFPWFMIAATTVFFPANWPRRIGLMHTPQDTGTVDRLDRSRQILIIGGSILFCLWQLLFPFRHFFYDGHVGWNEWGRDFSWRMKIDGKSANEIVYVLSYPNGEVQLVKARKHLTTSQYIRLERRPSFLHQYAQFIKHRYRRDFMYPEVRVNFKMAFNGRPPQYIIDPRVNLPSEEMSWNTPDWIVPLHNDIPAQRSCLSR